MTEMQLDLGSFVGIALAAIVGLAFLGTLAGAWTWRCGEGVLRGTLMGLTAGGNVFLGGLLLGSVIGAMAGSVLAGQLVIGAGLGLLTLLALIPAVARSQRYKTTLGWASYLLPMSWPGHVLGLIVFLGNLVGAIGALAVHRDQALAERLRIRQLKIDWKSASIVTLGGWVCRAGPKGCCAFNVGTFAWFDPGYGDGTIPRDILEHEAGHLLNNAAFGWFQAFNVVDPRPHDDRYFERLAESNVIRSTGKKIAQWG